MKAGDLLYTVYDDWVKDGKPTPVIKTITISTVTPKGVKIEGRSGLAFGCRSYLSFEDIKQRGYALTEQAAWANYIAAITKEIAQLDEEITDLRTRLATVRQQEEAQR